MNNYISIYTYINMEPMEIDTETVMEVEKQINTSSYIPSNDICCHDQIKARSLFDDNSCCFWFLPSDKEILVYIYDLNIQITIYPNSVFIRFGEYSIDTLVPEVLRIFISNNPNVLSKPIYETNLEGASKLVSGKSIQLPERKYNTRSTSKLYVGIYTGSIDSKFQKTTIIN